MQNALQASSPSPVVATTQRWRVPVRSAAAVAVAITVSVLGTVAPAQAGPASIDPGGFTPSSVAIDSNTHRSFALDPSTGAITVIDTLSGAVLGVLPGTVDHDYREAFLVADPVLGHVHTVGSTTTLGGRLSHLVETQTEDLGGVTAGWSGGSRSLGRARPLAATLDPFTHELFVTTTEESGPLTINRVTVLGGGGRPADASPPRNLARLPNNVEVDSIAVDPLLRQLYLSNRSAGTVSVLDEVSGAYKGLDVPAGRQPRGIAVDTYSHEVFVADALSGTVHVLDGYTRTASGAAIRVGGVPDELDIDQIAGRLYVKQDAGAGTGSISVIDATDHAPLGSDLGVGAVREVAVDGLGHTVHAVRSSGSSIAVIGG
jgi:DNA-binding beta-propeller fold protein YncE